MKIPDIGSKREIIGAFSRKVSPPHHPQYRTWLLYALTGIVRGRECMSNIQKYTNLNVESSKVLDFGCGEGGLAVAFAQAGAQVTAIDIDESRVEKTRALAADFEVSIDAGISNDYGAVLADESFDCIVCNDVIEHVGSPADLAASHARLMHRDGILYLPVPNRYSLRALRSDGHYGLPGLSLLGHDLGEAYVVRLAKRSSSYTVNRLLGWREVHRIYRQVGIRLASISDDGIRVRLRNRLARARLGLLHDSPLEGLAVRSIRYLVQEFWTFLGSKS